MLTTGADDFEGEKTKDFKDYRDFDIIEDDEIYGPEFGKLEPKSFRD